MLCVDVFLEGGVDREYLMGINGNDIEILETTDSDSEC